MGLVCMGLLDLHVVAEVHEPVLEDHHHHLPRSLKVTSPVALLWLRHHTDMDLFADEGAATSIEFAQLGQTVRISHMLVALWRMSASPKSIVPVALLVAAQVEEEEVVELEFAAPQDGLVSRKDRTADSSPSMPKNAQKKFKKFKENNLKTHSLFCFKEN